MKMLSVACMGSGCYGKEIDLEDPEALEHLEELVSSGTPVILVDSADSLEYVPQDGITLRIIPSVDEVKEE